MAGPPASTGGYQRALVDKLGVTISQHRHTLVHIENRPGKNRPVQAAALRSQSHPIIANIPYVEHGIHDILQLLQNHKLTSRRGVSFVKLIVALWIQKFPACYVIHHHSLLR
jgi:hypothetical protein